MVGKEIAKRDTFVSNPNQLDAGDRMQIAINAITDAHALNKLGTSVIEWEKVVWSSVKDSALAVGVTKINVKGKKRLCYIIGNPDPGEQHLFYNKAEWVAFKSGVKADEFGS